MQNKGLGSEEKSILIDIKLTGGMIVMLAIILVVAALVIYLALGGSSALAADAAAPQAASDGMRQYYLSSVLNRVCAAGYHMASFWEIADPSNLKYNTALGPVINYDLGGGPPTGLYGGVRTGYVSNSSTTPGHANCLLWSTYSVAIYGTVAKLPDSWTAGAEDLGVWDLSYRHCDEIHIVWCIED